MGLYVVVAVVCAVLVPVSYRRSGSMTRYVLMTGAPVVWVLLGLACAGSALVELSDPSTARGVFFGGLIGTAYVQVLLLRRSVKALEESTDDHGRLGRSRSPGGPLDVRADDGADDDRDGPDVGSDGRSGSQSPSSRASDDR